MVVEPVYLVGGVVFSILLELVNSPLHHSRSDHVVPWDMPQSLRLVEPFLATRGIRDRF